jgi:hypothetical protein
VTACLLGIDSGQYGMINIFSTSIDNINNVDYKSFIGASQVTMITDSNGIATFADLAIIDVSNGTGTFKLVFLIGDHHPGLYLASDISTKALPFINTATYTIIDEETQSSTISLEQPFVNPPII